MRLHRFYIQNDILETAANAGEGICTEESIVFQVSKVLRLQIGDKVYLFDSNHECECAILEISKKAFRYKVISNKKPKIPPKKTYLVQSLVKKDKFEFIAQKATELGITHIFPVISERSEKKGIVADRLYKIQVEAMEQSGWGSMPLIEPVQILDKALARLREQGIDVFYLDTNGNKYEKRSQITCMCIGPEGGWGERDVEIFKKHNGQGIRLEVGVLRAETAAVVGSFLLTQ